MFTPNKSFDFSKFKENPLFTVVIIISFAIIIFLLAVEAKHSLETIIPNIMDSIKEAKLSKAEIKVE